MLTCDTVSDIQIVPLNNELVICKINGPHGYHELGIYNDNFVTIREPVTSKSQFAFLGTQCDHYSQTNRISRSHMTRPIGLRSWCSIEVLFPVKLSLEIVRGDCACSQTQLAATRR